MDSEWNKSPLFGGSDKWLAFGNLAVCYEKSPCLMDNSTLNGDLPHYVSLPEGSNVGITSIVEIVVISILKFPEATI